MNSNHSLCQYYIMDREKGKEKLHKSEEKLLQKERSCDILQKSEEKLYKNKEGGKYV